ncbi:hypothetical protein B7494_g4496 [Chlorociboria aeruginascens]|nr:hypothetical protein B7494_g4496 [Chlorociboria aeruginascens]
MKTRAKGSGKGSKESAESTKISSQKFQLGPPSANPPKVFVLPDNITADARIVTLEHPRYSEETRYLICPEIGFYEFTQVAPPNITPRSWLLAPHYSDNKAIAVDKTEIDTFKGYVTKDANLFIATPIDPIFLLLPALSLPPSSKSSEPTKKLFLSGDDHLDNLISTSPHLRSFLRIESIRKRLEKSLEAVCDIVEAGDENMYRLSEEKLLKDLLRRAKKMMKHGLPASMEEKLIRKPLEAPVLGIAREKSSAQDGEVTDVPEETRLLIPQINSSDSQTSVSFSETTVSEISTAATSFSNESANDISQQAPKAISPPISAPDGVADLLRLRTAVFFICSKYLAPHLSEVLKDLLSRPASGINFAPLETHLEYVAKMREEALAARSLGDFSRKRMLNEDDEALEIRAEKKRKKEEEEKKEKGKSRGVKALAKVDTSGMKKMCDFFKKK